jgi:hypothetical protein
MNAKEIRPVMAMPKWIAPATILLAGGLLGYIEWVHQCRVGVYRALSFERIRYAHVSDEDRDRMTCLGAHGRKDLGEGQPRSLYIPIYKTQGLMRRQEPPSLLVDSINQGLSSKSPKISTVAILRRSPDGSGYGWG